MLLLAPRGAFLEPNHVGVIRRRINIPNQSVAYDRWHGSVVPPAMNFGVAIHKGQTTRAMVVASRQIVKAGSLRVIRPTAHICDEVAPINAVLTHVHQQPSARRTRISQFGHPKEDAPALAAVS